VEFEWDPNKAASNEEKHRVSFAEAATIFADPLEVSISDPDRSHQEFRFISMGRTAAGKLLVVSYTEREQNRIRIINARRATKHEQRCYEQSH